MRSQSVAKGTMIMIAVGFVTKVLGMANRVVITRFLGETGVGVYMLISPTIMLLATIATVGLPVAIPTLISRASMRQRKVLGVSLVISMSLSLLITVVLFFAARPLATYMLKDERAYLPLLLTGPLLFFVSFSSILKSYFQGKQNMTPGAVATLIEQVVRIFLSVFLIRMLLPISITHAIVGLMVASILGELISALILTVMFVRYKRRVYPDVRMNGVKLESTNFRDVLGISLPTTGSRLIGTITHFLEPIIVARALFRIGYTNEMSTKLYGAVSGFAIPVLFMPSFISSAVTQSIIPAISKAHSLGRFDLIQRSLNAAFKIAFFTSGFYTVMVMLFPFEIVNLLYLTDTGANFLYMMAPVFFLLYFQAPLVATMQAINESKLAMKASIVASVIKIGLMVVLLAIPGVNIYGLVIAILANIVISTVWYYVIVVRKTGYRPKIWKVINGLLVLGIVYAIGRHMQNIGWNFDSELTHVLAHSGILLVVHSVLSFIVGLFPIGSRRGV